LANRHSKRFFVGKTTLGEPSLGKSTFSLPIHALHSQAFSSCPIRGTSTQPPLVTGQVLGFYINKLLFMCSMSINLFLTRSSAGSGSKYFDPGSIGSIFCCSGQVSHLWFGFEFGKFPLKMSNFQFFSLRVKKNLFGLGQKVPGSKMGWPLIYCGSKVCSAGVGSGQVPSLIRSKSVALESRQVV